MTYRMPLGIDQIKIEEEAKRSRFAYTMGAVDRVLSDNCKALIVANFPHAVPGWTDGETVNINGTALPALVNRYGDPVDRSLVTWLGVNGHEVGHTMYSPRAASPLHNLMSNMIDDGMYLGIDRVYNLAEDQRMERLTVARFRPWRTYLTAAAVHLLVENLVQEQDDDRHQIMDEALLSQLWPLVAGRTWMPPVVRRMALDAWDKNHGVGAGMRIAKLIGEYQRIADPGYEDAKHALQVLMALHAELEQQGESPEDMKGTGCDSAGMTGGDLPDAGEVDDSRAPSAGSDQDQQQLAAAEAEAEAAMPKDSDEGQGQGQGESESSGDSGQGTSDQGEGDAGSEGESGSDSGQGDEGKGDEGSGGDAGSGSQPGEGQQSQGSGDAGGQGSERTPSGSGSSSGSAGTQQGQGTQQEGPTTLPTEHEGGTGHAKVRTLADLRPWFNEEVRRAMVHDRAVVRDLTDVRKAIEGTKRHSTLGHKSGENRGGRGDQANLHKEDEYMPVRDDVRRIARAVSEHMRHLVDETLPQWNRRVESGKLNVNRYMLREVGDPLDTMFDRFQMGMQDSVSLDVSVLLDVSSSMGWMPKLGPSPKNDIGIPTGWPLPIVPAAEATWAIQRAVEAAEGDVTVYAFDRTGYIISPTGRRVHPDNVLVPAVGGGTNPTPVLNELMDRLPGVEAHHRIVVAVTDGSWQGSGEPEKVMQALAARGVVTIGVLLDPYLNVMQGGNEGQTTRRINEWQTKRAAIGEGLLDKMGVQYGAVMDNCLGMVPLFEQVVTEVMFRAMQGVS